MQRSHSRHSHPFDKRVPVMEKLQAKYNVYINFQGVEEAYKYYTGYGSVGRQAVKELHKTKQRQYDRRLCREPEQ